jgi:beta-glucuronidase
VRPVRVARGALALGAVAAAAVLAAGPSAGAAARRPPAAPTVPAPGTTSARVTLATGSRRAAPAQPPTAGAWYVDGPSGRYLLGGTWLRRPDDGVGLRDRFQDSRSTAAWTAVTVPNAWNAGQTTTASYRPSITWYRRDFRLPSSSAADAWIVRFESVNNEATVWLNGHRLASHTGAFLPFELRLPDADLDRTGVNRLVLRISDGHAPTDLPPATSTGPSGVVGGWWNYGGILREVYLRRVRAIDFASVQVSPRLACATCAATVGYSVVLRNDDAQAQRVALRTSFGGTVASLGRRTIGGGATATFTGSVRISQPQLWSPSTPHLYAVTLDASAAAATSSGPLRAVAHYTLQSGIRNVSVRGGALYLNFLPVHARGVGLIEDSPTAGSALSQAQQLALISAAKALGATIIRSQYPLSQYEEQLADQQGIMLWSEIPAYQVPDPQLRAAIPGAIELLREDVRENGDHPSIAIWSVGNELDPSVGPSESAYIAATVAAAHRLDPTRPVGLAYQGYPQIGCQKGYGPLDVLGINDYFGWYPGPGGQIADPSLLPDYLAQERACYPKQALMVTEFGAEANRDGPVDERGTYEFQTQFATSQLTALNATPWLSGAVWWALQDFEVHPGWTGGNPYPTPPLFSKGLVSFSGQPKPAYAAVQALFTATKQLG